MGVTKDKVVAGIINVALIGSALLLAKKVLKPDPRFGADTFRASGSSSKLMTEKAAINALTTAKGKFMTVTFLKKDGSTRRMRCRTGVKRYVKGVGSPLGSPANRLQKYKLITVYDLDKAGYRSIPVDRVISVKAAGKTFSSKNPKGKQMSAEEYNSYNAEWEAIFETFGRRGYFADLSDDETEGMNDNEIMELVLDEGDLGWEEDPELIPDVLEKHAEFPRPGYRDRMLTYYPGKHCSVCGVVAVHVLKKGEIVLCDKHYQQQFGKYSNYTAEESYILCNCGDAAKWQWQIIESLFRIDDDPIVSEIVVAEHFRDSDEYCTGCFEKEYGWNPELSSLVGMNPPCGECGGPTTEEIDSAVDGTYVYQCANQATQKWKQFTSRQVCEWNSWPPHREHEAESFEADSDLKKMLMSMATPMTHNCDLCPWQGDFEDFNYHIAYDCPGTISHRNMLVKAYEEMGSRGSWRAESFRGEFIYHGKKCWKCKKRFEKYEPEYEEIDPQQGFVNVCEDCVSDKSPATENRGVWPSLGWRGECIKCGAATTDDPQIGHDKAYPDVHMFGKETKKGVLCYPCQNIHSVTDAYDSYDLEAPYGGSGALMDIGKDTALGSFSPSELATSSAIHGDFDQASLNYSGAQNIVVRAEDDDDDELEIFLKVPDIEGYENVDYEFRPEDEGEDAGVELGYLPLEAESDRDEDEEDYEQYLRLQGLCECTACGEVTALSTGTTDKQGLYRCIACVTAKQPSISEEEVVEDIEYLRGIH